jgi:hypothetical protein
MSGNATFRIVLSRLTTRRLTHSTASVAHFRSSVGVPGRPALGSSGSAVRLMTLR